MSAWGDIRPAGYAATAAEFLGEAAADGDGRDLAVRQLAALQDIGWALLAACDQLADVTGGVADCATQLSEIAGAPDDLSRVISRRAPARSARQPAAAMARGARGERPH